MWSSPPEATDRKTLSTKQEERLAVELDTNLTPGSGNQPFPSQKGDAQEDEFVMEMKRVKGASITVDAHIIGKVYREAMMLGKHPVLLLTCDGMPDPIPKDWAIVPASLFRSLFPKENDDD